MLSRWFVNILLLLLVSCTPAIHKPYTQAYKFALQGEPERHALISRYKNLRTLNNRIGPMNPETKMFKPSSWDRSEGLTDENFRIFVTNLHDARAKLAKDLKSKYDQHKENHPAAAVMYALYWKWVTANLDIVFLEDALDDSAEIDKPTRFIARQLLANTPMYKVTWPHGLVYYDLGYIARAAGFSVGNPEEFDAFLQKNGGKLYKITIGDFSDAGTASYTRKVAASGTPENQWQTWHIDNLHDRMKVLSSDLSTCDRKTELHSATTQQQKRSGGNLYLVSKTTTWTTEGECIGHTASLREKAIIREELSRRERGGKRITPSGTEVKTYKLIKWTVTATGPDNFKIQKEFKTSPDTFFSSDSGDLHQNSLKNMESMTGAWLAKAFKKANGTPAIRGRILNDQLFKDRSQAVLLREWTNGTAEQKFEVIGRYAIEAGSLLTQKM